MRRKYQFLLPGMPLFHLLLQDSTLGIDTLEIRRHGSFSYATTFTYSQHKNFFYLCCASEISLYKLIIFFNLEQFIYDCSHKHQLKILAYAYALANTHRDAIYLFCAFIFGNLTYFFTYIFYKFMAKCNEYNERGAIVKNKYLFYREKASSRQISV